MARKFFEADLGRRSMKLRCLVVAVCALLAFAPTAFAAGGSAGKAYGGNAGGVQNEVNQGAAAGTSSLPFTGLDLALLVVGGVTLLVVGAGLRRAAKRPT
jgi:hypothetical protein